MLIYIYRLWYIRCQELSEEKFKVERKIPFYFKINNDLLVDLRKLSALDKCTMTSILEKSLQEHLPERLNKHGITSQSNTWRSWGKI